jgi:4-hydroxy-tetrahydrodipicolinate reductase
MKEMDMAEIIRVAVAGAKGRMGSEAVKMIVRDPALKLVSAVDSTLNGADVGETIGIGHIGVPFFNHFERAIKETSPDVMVDLTVPRVVYEHTRMAIELGVRPVVGTTGLTSIQLEELDNLCRDKGLGGLVAPNFAIGAVLMMAFAQQAAKYLPHVEIIEMHHDQKLDAPSGTAIKTAERIAEARKEFMQGHPTEKETLDGVRGGIYNGFRIHSVRLPGLVAHQEVIFGDVGQTLTLRHDSIDRKSFMPGINLAIKKVMGTEGLKYGLEHFLD